MATNGNEINSEGRGAGKATSGSAAGEPNPIHDESSSLCLHLSDSFGVSPTAYALSPITLLSTTSLPLPLPLPGACPGVSLFSGALVLGDFVDAGRAYAAHRASLTSDHPACFSCGITHPTTRVADPGPLLVKAHRVDSNRPQARREVGREAWIYDHLLAREEGVAPRWYGVYGVGPSAAVEREKIQEGGEAREGGGEGGGGGGKYLLAVMEYAGQTVTDPTSLPLKAKYAHDEKSNEDADAREQILALYARLHSAGVVHVTASRKHWIWDGADAGTMRLVDFGSSYIRDSPGVPAEMRGEWEALEDWVFDQEAAAEIEGVRAKLGWA